MMAQDVILWERVDQALAELMALKGLSDNSHPQTTHWLKSIGRRTLQKNSTERAPALAKALPNNAVPEGMQRKIENGGRLMLALPDQETMQKLANAIDCMRIAEDYGEIQPERLAKMAHGLLQRPEQQSGNVPQLFTYNSFSLDKALALHDKFVHYSILHNPRRNLALTDADETIVWTHPDEPSWQLIQLLTVDALEKEGERMGHCIGSGSYGTQLTEGSAQLYSLRSHGRPHVSFEVSDNRLQQSQGKGNQPPIHDYLPFVAAAILAMGWDVGDAPYNQIGLIKTKQGLLTLNEFQVSTKLTVYENLDLTGCTGLTSLPDNLTVKGYLDLSECTALTALPDNLTVSVGLDLNNCTSLTTLGANLRVGWNLNLSGCTALMALPDNLTVGMTLILRDCIGLTALPDNLTVLYLILTDCTSLKMLPDNLTIQALDLTGCTALTTLPDNLRFGGNLYLKGCKSLKTLPDNLTVEGNLDLRDCSSLKTLPDNLRVGGSLYLWDCKGLTVLPENLTVGGELVLSGCTSLKALPQNLTVEGNLDLRDCSSLKTLPDNIKLGRDLILRDCTGLTVLPRNLTVNGNLNLMGCTALTTLPDNLTVEQLDLTGCTSLTALPRNLTVNGNLNLSGCTALTALPDNLTVKQLDLTGCTRLKALPRNLTVESLNLSGCTGLTLRSLISLYWSRTLSFDEDSTAFPEHIMNNHPILVDFINFRDVILTIFWTIVAILILFFLITICYGALYLAQMLHNG